MRGNADAVLRPFRAIEKPTPKLQKERRIFSPLFFYKIGYLFSLSASVGLMPYTFLK